MEFTHSFGEVVLANLVIFLATIVQASTGMGFAMVAVPLLVLINLDFVPGISLFINLFLAILMLQDGLSKIAKKEIAMLLPFIAVGTIIAIFLLFWIPERKLGFLFSVIILIAIIITLFAKNTGLTPQKLAVGGLVAGLMGTVSGIHGAPLAVLYQHENLEKTRATLALVFLFAYAFSLIGLWYTGAFGLPDIVEGVALFPGLVFGFFVAKRIQGLISEYMARHLMLAIATAGAITLLIKTWGA